MAAGLRVFNPDGSLQFDSSNRLYRVLTLNDIGGANTGSQVVTGVKGTLGVVMQPQNDTGEPPTVTVSGSVVSWDYRGVATRQSTRVIMVEY